MVLKTNKQRNITASKRYPVDALEILKVLAFGVDQLKDGFLLLNILRVESQCANLFSIGHGMLPQRLGHDGVTDHRGDDGWPGL